MKFFKPIFVLLLVLNGLVTKSQNNAGCDIIHDIVQVQPNYKNGAIDLYKYVNSELIPIISKCNIQSSNDKSSFIIVLIVQSNGVVSDVQIPNNIIAHDCEKEVRQKILSMNGWTAGQFNNEYVCSRFKLPINFNKWR